MIDIQIDASEIDALASRLDQAPPRMAAAVVDEVVLPNLAKYPGQSHRKMQFVSAKARRYFFAALRSGQISVPYRRTGKLGSEWSRQTDDEGITLTSTRPYGELVRGPGQAAYFAGVWPTMDAVAEESEPMAALAATAALVDIIGDAG